MARDSAGESGMRCADVSAGQVYCFRTRPYSEFAAPVMGRYAALKVLGVNHQCVVVAVLDGIWPEAPTLADTRTRAILNAHRFNFQGRPCVFGVFHQVWAPQDDLEEFSLLGTLPLSDIEQSHFQRFASHAPMTSWAGLYWANISAEGEWRWKNDRDALVTESEKVKAKRDAEFWAKVGRHRNRLRKLTWDQLQSETPFERWAPSPPFPPEKFIAQARTVIRDACDALRALGARPRRPEVRAILKNTVLWFNEADEKAGGVIETEEREDICAVLEEMAHLARQKALVDEIDEWREW